MDDDVIVIYDEIEEEPEQFTSQNYEYMLAQSLLTKKAIQEKLSDPSEASNFQFINSSSQNNSIWDKFQAITYGGVEQNFFKCRDCNEIFDKDPQKSLEQLRNHKCSPNTIKRETLEVQEVCKTPPKNTSRKNSNKNADKPKLLTREELLELYSNPKERPFLVTKQKNTFRCFAWQWMDLVFYKKQRQPFARCRFCETLVTYSNKNGTSSIRKHALRCQAILAAKYNLGKAGIQAPNLESEGQVKYEDEDSYSEDENNELNSSLIPDVEMYEEDKPLDSLLEEAEPSMITPIKKTETTRAVSTRKNNNLLSLSTLKSLYNSNKTSKAFHFSRSRQGGVKNTIWNWLELVFYKDYRQQCYRCTICNTLISSANENDLILHVQKHNVNLNNNSKKQQQSIKKEKLTETHTESKSKTSSKRHTLPATIKAESIVSQTVENNEINGQLENELDATNNVNKSLTDFVISSGGQFLNLIEDPNFQLFTQNLINFGAKFGNRQSKDFLPTSDTILKHSIPQRVQKIQAEIREYIGNDHHLSLSVDLVKDSAPFSKPVSYLTVKAHIINEHFKNKTFVMGVREFSNDTAIAEAVLDTFLEIMDDYVNPDDLKYKGIIVINENNEILTDAFAEYTHFPSITHSLESIINKVLQVQDPDLNISNVVVKVQELFDHITKEHNYSLNRGECLLDLLEEFYEMNKPIEKLLKNTRQCEKDHTVLSDIPKNKVKTILNGFEVIKLCIDTIRQNQITINGLVLWKKKMVEQYSPVLFEHHLNAKLKSHTLKLIETDFPLDDSIYKIGLFLNPNFKNLKFFSESEKKEVFDAVREFYLIKISQHKNDGIKVSEKKEKDMIDKEIHSYYVTKSFDSSSEDLLKFWKSTTAFPNLRTLARYVLSLPSSSDGVHEELFRKAHRSLANNNIGTSADYNSIVFLNSNSNYVEV